MSDELSPYAGIADACTNTLWTGSTPPASRSLLDDMRRVFEAESQRPAEPTRAEVICLHCRLYGTAIAPGPLTCPRCGERTVLGTALGASEWDDLA